MNDSIDKERIADRLQAALTWCHNMLRNQEGMSPESALRELNKLLFVKLFCETDNDAKSDLDSILHGGRHIYTDTIFPSLFDEAKDMYRDEKIFDYSDSIIAKYSTCLDIIEALRFVDILQTTPEMGKAYESYVRKVLKNTSDVMFVPQTIVEYVADYLDIKSTSNVVDPNCGYGGCLSAIPNMPQRDTKGTIVGYEKDLLMAQTATMNMLMHGNNFRIERIKEGDNNSKLYFDYVLTSVGQHEKIEEFFQNINGLLKPDGIACLIMPDDVLQKGQFTYLRRKLLEQSSVMAIISLPKGAVKVGNKTIKTSIIIVQKGKTQADNSKTLFAKIEKFGVSEFGIPTEENDLKQIEPIVLQWLQKGIEKQGKSVMWVNLLGADEWNVDAELVREENRIVSKYPLLRLGDLVELRVEGPVEFREKEYKRVTVRKRQHDVIQRDKVSTKDIKNKSRQTVVHSGEILVSRIGAKDGSIGIVPKSLDGAIVSDNFIILNIRKREINPYYLLTVLTSDRYKKILSGISRGITDRSYIKNVDLLNIEIPLPDMEKQIELTEKLEETQRRINNLERKWTEGIASFSKELFGQ